jgi:hypothetical protein
MFYMLTDVYYRGYRIVWDARQLPGSPFWTGVAAVVLPADATGVKRIQRIRENGHFATAEDARNHVITAAKDWIDAKIASDNTPG